MTARTVSAEPGRGARDGPGTGRRSEGPGGGTIRTMERSPEAEDRLIDLVFLALAHGVSSVEFGGPLIPFVISQEGNDRIIHRFLDEQPGGISLEGSLEGARHYATGLGKMVQAWVVAHEATVAEGGRERPAVIAEAHDPASGTSLRYAQPYRPKRLFRKAHAVGGPVRLD